MTQPKKAPSQPKPIHFFQKELAGEDAPSLATMEVLYELAMELFNRRPWALLQDDELVLVKEPVSGEVCYCCVLGALGEVFAVHAYRGPESYRLHRRIQSGQAMMVGEFFGSQCSVYVEFVRRSELEAPDRKLLTALGHPQKRGAMAPIFRAIRPGYHPWYVTEGEAQILAECQRGVIAMCGLLETGPEADYWDKEDVYPLLLRHCNAGTEPEYRIDLVKVHEPPVPSVEVPTLDEARIRRVRDHGYPSHGILEVDQFYGPGMIGKKTERKACFRVALAIDAESAFAYPPEVTLPSTSTGDALTGAVLRAIESAHALPH